MSDGNESRRGRREFFRAAARAAAGGAIAAVTAVLAGGSRPTRPGDRCVGDGLCRRCASIAGCDLPQATSVKRGGPKS